MKSCPEERQSCSKEKRRRKTKGILDNDKERVKRTEKVIKGYKQMKSQISTMKDQILFIS